MSIAPRLTNCLTAWKSWPGQPVRFGQIVHTPPSGLTVCVPHAGHLAGGLGTGERFLRFWAFAVGETTRGITSPARVTITSSPSRTSLRRMSSSLWSVASFTVTPDTWTGSSTANGTMCPVRPTFHATRSSIGRRGHRRELPGDGAARLAPDDAEAPLQAEVVDLHDHAVDLEVEALALLLPARTGLQRRVERLVHLDRVVDREAALAQEVERLALGGELDSLVGPDRVRPHREWPRGGELRVELADRAGRRVARVREGRLAGGGALLVELRERRARQVCLAADLEQRRRVVDPQRDRLDRAQVRGDVLARPRRRRAWRRA